MKDQKRSIIFACVIYIVCMYAFARTYIYTAYNIQETKIVYDTSAN